MCFYGHEIVGGYSRMLLSGIIEMFYILIGIWLISANVFITIDQTVHLGVYCISLNDCYTSVKKCLHKINK